MVKNLKEVIKEKLLKNTEEIATKYSKIAKDFAKKETKQQELDKASLKMFQTFCTSFE